MATDQNGVKTVAGWASLNMEETSTHDVVGASRATSRLIKRGVDILIALTALVAILPLLLIVAAAVKLQDGGPVLFSHRRVGRDGREFGCLKFRTMRTDAADVLARLLASAPHLRAEWEESRKLKQDPRITPIGDVLRRSSIDELPQLFNVLCGQMSIVGPRPITREELQRYGEHVNLYLTARPGLTGHWQTSGRSEVEYHQRVLLDVEYVRSWSVIWDFVIMAKTIPVLFSRRGSY